MTKAKKSIIAISIIVVIIGIIVGGTFGGKAISNAKLNAKMEKEWQAKQGHDTSLIWVNINNMLAEPKLIENDTYNYENYTVKVPNTTALSVLSYKVGKDATGEFYYDSECQNKIVDIKNIDVSEELYSKTIYLKIVSQKEEKKVVKIDIDIDKYLIEGTGRKANAGGHIEIPSNMAKVTLDSVPYKVIRQSNIQVLYTANDKENFILAENVIIGQLIPEISIFDGNNYEISLAEKANYMTNLEERGDGDEGWTELRNFECVIERATTIKNINYSGFPDRLVTFVKRCNTAYQIKVKNATICDYMVGADYYDQLTKFVFKNNLIIQESGSNRGMVQLVMGALIFNCINYTETNATLTVMQTQNKVGIAKEEQEYIFWEGSGGISTLAEGCKFINCYNFLDTVHGWASSGIVGIASGEIIHCNNYGNIELPSSPTPSTPFHNSRFIEQWFREAFFTGAGGIVICMCNPSKYNEGKIGLKIENQKILDCSNYGNIYYYKKITKECAERINRHPIFFKYENFDKENIGQIVKRISENDVMQNCNEYGKIIKKQGGKGK